MSNDEQANLLVVVGLIIFFLPFEVSLFFWLSGHITFIQAFFGALIIYPLVALTVYILRRPFIVFIAILIGLN